MFLHFHMVPCFTIASIVCTTIAEIISLLLLLILTRYLNRLTNLSSRPQTFILVESPWLILLMIVFMPYLEDALSWFFIRQVHSPSLPARSSISPANRKLSMLRLHILTVSWSASNMIKIVGERRQSLRRTLNMETWHIIQNK